MSLVVRPPCDSLLPVARLIWASSGSTARSDREIVLPSGTAHLVFRLETPLCVYRSAHDRVGKIVGHSVIGGPRAEAYVRDTSQPVTSVGVELRAGAISVLLGDRADAFAHQHLSLSDVWGQDAELIREELGEIICPQQRLSKWEQILEARFRQSLGLHPAVLHALERFRTTSDVKRIASETGYGVRRFSTLFCQAIGLPPKVYGRLQRFSGALTQLKSGAQPLSLIAELAGYADQAHFTREFREFALLTPGAYRRTAPVNARHVPLVSTSLKQD